jgi:hypothetical protein
MSEVEVAKLACEQILMSDFPMGIPKSVPPGLKPALILQFYAGVERAAEKVPRESLFLHGDLI